jgi:3-deoxy-D-manno-octulosonate 8-phosphate phosphatase (KDO 8-P phosphatase)
MRNVTHLVIDADGTLTDGGIYYDDHGNELKKFSARDGTGFLVASAAGFRLIILTGRECGATLRRMRELGADVIEQNVKNKAEWLKKYMETNGLAGSNVG